MTKGDLPKNNGNSDEEELRKTQLEISRLKKKLEAQRKATELKQQELDQRSSGKSNEFAQNEYSSDFYDASKEAAAAKSPRPPVKPAESSDKSSKKFISGDNAWESAMADTPDFSEDDLLFSGKGNAQTRPDSADFSAETPPRAAKPAAAPKAAPAVASGKFRIPLQDSDNSASRAVFDSRPLASGERPPTDSRSNLRARPDLRRGGSLAPLIRMSAYAGGVLALLTVIGLAGLYLDWHLKLPLSLQMQVQLDSARSAIFGKSSAPAPAAKPEKAAPPRRTLKTRPIPQE